MLLLDFWINDTWYSDSYSTLRQGTFPWSSCPAVVPFRARKMARFLRVFTRSLPFSFVYWGFRARRLPGWSCAQPSFHYSLSLLPFSAQCRRLAPAPGNAAGDCTTAGRRGQPDSVTEQRVHQWRKTPTLIRHAVLFRYTPGLWWNDSLHL